MVSSSLTFQRTHLIAFSAFVAWNLPHTGESLTAIAYHLPSTPVPLLPDTGLTPFTLAQIGGCLLLAFKKGIRIGAGVSWLLLLYATLADRINSFSLNSIYLFTFLVIALTFSGGVPSASSRRILKTMILTLYASSGWHKAVYGDWLTQPHTLASLLKGHHATPVGAYMLESLPFHWISLLQYAVLAFELFAPALFLSRRLCNAAVLFGCLFHVGIAFCMADLGIFSLLMISFYPLFIAAPRRDTCNFQRQNDCDQLSIMFR